MQNETYISEFKQKKINATLIAIGMAMGCFLTSFVFVSLMPVDAKGDTISQVRSNQSEMYEAAARASSALIESSKQLDYIMASAHDNAKKLDFQRE